MEGSKWYGNHLGPYKTPAKEDDPRLPVPHFYYAQQDWLARRQAANRWTWSALRPHAVCGFALGSNLNLLNALALYAAITKHLGLPLRFPGKPGAFTAIYQMTDASLLARAMVWAATTPRCANEAFNLTNGDFIRWCNVWPVIAAFFGMDVGPVQHFDLVQIMADKEPLWAEICEKHGLRRYTLAELVNWAFGDFVFNSDFDIMSSMTKARQYGWTEVLDTETMLIRSFDRLRAQRIIP
jgi:nucleoside-diphosphate-sugar epimerase